MVLLVLTPLTAAWATTAQRAPGYAPLAVELTRRGSTEQGDEFRWAGRIPAGRAIEIEGVNGDLRAVAAISAEVEVTATKRGRKSDPDEVEIRVVEHDDGVTICAVYPSPSSRKPNECAPGERGRMHTENNDVMVNFTVRVPAGVRFIGRTVNGDVEAADLDAEVRAHTVNGGVTLSTKSYAEAATVNGSITASIGRADWQESLEFETVNGSITLNLPDEVNTEVRAETVTGEIFTDFPLTVKGKFGPRRVSGTIGKGGRELHLGTVNGSIRLRRKA